jgi:hypothetical protein
MPLDAPMNEHRDYWLHKRLQGIETALDALLSFAGLQQGLTHETTRALVDVRDRLRRGAEEHLPT